MKSRKPLITFFIGLLVTAIICSGLSLMERRNAKAEFDFEADRIHQIISKRLSSYEELLRGVKAFFMASKEVSLQEWEIYFDQLRFKNFYPGLQGIAYVQRVKSEAEYDALSDRLQSYGIENFKIKPEGIRDEYFPVIFLSPMDEKNAKAVGYDIFSEQIRRNAINSARDTESTSITRKITLVQEGEKDKQSGLLMMVPFFTNERIDKHHVPKEYDGIIDGVIRMDDFSRAVIDPAFLQNMHIRIYDQEIDQELSEQNLLFDSMKKGDAESLSRRFSNSFEMQHYGQNWVVTVEGEPAANFLPLFFGEKSDTLNLAILVVGIGLSGLGFYATRAFETTARLRKEKVARSLAIKADMDIIKRQEESLLKFKEKSEYLFVCLIDIENSTNIAAKLSESESAEFYSTFHNVIGEIITAKGGVIVKSMGDAILYYFRSSSPPSIEDCRKAIDCCLEIISSNEKLNSQLNQKTAQRINYRISSVYGSVMTASKEGIRDIFGSTVNQCSKINRFAKTNGLVVSEGIRNLLDEEPSYEIKKIDHDIPAEHGGGVYHIS